MDPFWESLSGYDYDSPYQRIANGSAVITESDALRLYEALAANPLTAERLADRSGTQLQCVIKWLATQTARGHLAYDPGSQRYWMQQEHARQIAQAPSRAYMNAAFAVWSSGRLLARC